MAKIIVKNMNFIEYFAILRKIILYLKGITKNER